MLGDDVIDDVTKLQALGTVQITGKVSGNPRYDFALNQPHGLW